MKDVKGLKINHLDFQPFKMGDFLYYEGPLLSHFIDKNNPNDHYFYRWVDFDDAGHRWLIFKASDKDIKAFLNKNMSLWQMITQKSTVTLVDFDDDLNKKQILVVAVSELPNTYLPSEKSYFQEEQYQPYASELKNQLDKKESEQNTLNELLKKVYLLDDQQKKTFNLLNEMSSVLSGQGKTWTSPNPAT